MRKLDKLNAPLLATITKAAKPSRHSDGSGLYLTISRWGTPSWCFRYLARGGSCLRDMGLGAYPAITLKQARELAGEARMALQRGIDPIDQRKAVQQAARAERAKEISFKEAAERYIESHKAGWRNEKHASQWQATLTTYAYPVIAKLGMARIATHHITEILEPIWAIKPETASRVRGRIESILDWAKARHYREGDNPARWKGHIENLLPAKSKVRTVRHQPAMPFVDVPTFTELLRANSSISAKALEFTILTAARTTEAINATWDEVDLEAAVWTVPGERMKSGREHRVPLSTRLIALLNDIPRDVALVIVDPITAYLGKTDSHKTADVRAVLAPLQELASRKNVAIVAVSHLNKSVGGGKSINAVTGSGAFVAAARAAFLVVKDKNDLEKVLLIEMKNNIGKAEALAFRVLSHLLPSHIATSFVQFDPGTLRITADEAIGLGSDDGRLSALGEAAEFLKTQFFAGPVRSADLFERAAQAGIAQKTLRRAAKKIGVLTQKDGFQGEWLWNWPPAGLVAPTNPNLPKGSAAQEMGTFQSWPPLNEVGQS